MPATAKDRALRLLSTRSRSRRELRDRLIRAGFPEGEIEAALEDLEAVGLVDDERFAAEAAESLIRARGLGRRGVIAALRKVGVDAATAERAVDETLPDDEEARAEDLARARLSRLSGLAPDAAYRRMLGFLQRRGFDGSAARAVCRRVLESRPEQVAPSEPPGPEPPPGGPAL